MSRIVSLLAASAVVAVFIWPGLPGPILDRLLTNGLLVYIAWRVTVGRAPIRFDR